MGSSNHREEYETLLVQYDRVISACTAISQGASGRKVNTQRDYYASILFVRLCAIGISLLILCPGNRLSRTLFEHWDLTAIATITRNLIDCFVTFFYLGDKAVSDCEWECRWNIFNLHDCLRGKKMFEHFDSEKEHIDKFSIAAADLRKQLEENDFFQKLPDAVQKESKRGRRILLQSRDEIIANLGMDIDFFRGYYIFLSCHAHSYPLGFYRMGENNRGRGVENISDSHHVQSALEVATHVVKKCARNMIERFPGADRDVSRECLESVLSDDEDN